MQPLAPSFSSKNASATVSMSARPYAGVSTSPLRHAGRRPRRRIVESRSVSTAGICDFLREMLDQVRAVLYTKKNGVAMTLRDWLGCKELSKYLWSKPRRAATQAATTTCLVKVHFLPEALRPSFARCPGCTIFQRACYQSVKTSLVQQMSPKLCVRLMLAFLSPF